MMQDDGAVLFVMYDASVRLASKVILAAVGLSLERTPGGVNRLRAARGEIEAGLAEPELMRCLLC